MSIVWYKHCCARWDDSLAVNSYERLSRYSPTMVTALISTGSSSGGSGTPWGQEAPPAGDQDPSGEGGGAGTMIPEPVRCAALGRDVRASVPTETSGPSR